MSTRKYKKGMADTAQAYAEFGKKQEEALNFILDEVRQGRKSLEEAIRELGDNFDGLYEHLKSKEKAQLYTVYTPFDIKELGKWEKLFLIGALYRLTIDKTPNENQQNFLRAVQKYLEIKEPPSNVDIMSIENIESIPIQKAIFQTVLEFLRLQDGDCYDETDLQNSFLDSFSINSKSRQAIFEHVELIYKATGAKGLAEKYGYVEEDEDGDGADTSAAKSEKGKGVSEEAVKKLSQYVKDSFTRTTTLETENYFLTLKEKEHAVMLFPEFSKICAISKADGTEITFSADDSMVHGWTDVFSVGDTALVYSTGTLHLIDIAQKSSQVIYSNDDGFKIVATSAEKLLLKLDNNFFMLDLDGKQIPFNGNVTRDYTCEKLVQDILSLSEHGRKAVIEYVELQRLKEQHRAVSGDPLQE